MIKIKKTLIKKIYNQTRYGQSFLLQICKVSMNLIYIQIQCKQDDVYIQDTKERKTNDTLTKLVDEEGMPLGGCAKLMEVLGSCANNGRGPKGQAPCWYRVRQRSMQRSREVGEVVTGYSPDVGVVSYRVFAGLSEQLPGIRRVQGCRPFYP